MSNSGDAIIKHWVTAPNGGYIVQDALKILRPCLRTSLPLYRRLQGGLFLDQTCLLTSLDLTKADSQDERGSPWLIAFVDRSCRPETEVWFYGSWEGNDSQKSTEDAASIDALVLNLCKATKDLGLPASIHQNGDDHGTEAAGLEITKDTGGYSRDEYGGHASNPNIMLWGGVHEKNVPILRRLGLIGRDFESLVVPNHTFIWNVDEMADARPLPNDLRWGEVKPGHFALVRSRTQIPRQERTMAVLQSLAIYPVDSQTPIAWVFVGLDSSLTTLHVEPEWRGKGLAKAITTKLLKEKLGKFWEEGVEKTAFGYVMVGNKASEGMCLSLGGRSDWAGYWLRVDLGGC